MGTAIAAAGVQCGLKVSITDVDPAVLAAAPQAIHEELTEDVRPAADALLRTVDTVDDLAGCDIVIESVVENLSLKQDLYRRIAGQLAPEAILASNTSTIPIQRLAEGLSNPGRFCGIHFFHPVRRRPLVEIVRGSQTTDATIARARSLAGRIEKMAITVGDGPGFLVNRLLCAYLNEALQLLLEGVAGECIEAAAVGFGMAMGPLELLDEIGLDTALRSGAVLAAAFPERAVASPILVSMVKAGRLGKKAGRGFFSHAADSTPNPRAAPRGAIAEHSSPPLDPAAEKAIAAWAEPRHDLPPDTIAARLFLPMLLESTRLLAENKVQRPDDIDLGVVFGLGFPAARGGLLYWADTVGAARIVDWLQPLAGLGPRAQPTPMLIEMAQRGGRFY